MRLIKIAYHAFMPLNTRQRVSLLDAQTPLRKRYFRYFGIGILSQFGAGVLCQLVSSIIHWQYFYGSVLNPNHASMEAETRIILIKNIVGTLCYSGGIPGFYFITRLTPIISSWVISITGEPLGLHVILFIDLIGISLPLALSSAIFTCHCAKSKRVRYRYVFVLMCTIFLQAIISRLLF